MNFKNAEIYRTDYVGKSIPRRDGPDKVTGRAKYTVDIKLPGLLVGRILRSPHPHAKILNIDTSRATSLKGVKAVITAQDTIGVKHGFVETPRYPPDQWPLASDRVRFVGEEIAASCLRSGRGHATRCSRDPSHTSKGERAPRKHCG